MRGTRKGRLEGRIAQVREEVDAYELTIQAMLALEKIFGETLQAQARQGPSMLTSTGHKVTPDMTFEVTRGRFAGYRAVNEVKSQYPSRSQPARRLALQLQQYDDITSGWSLPAATGRSGRSAHDLVLTVPTDHARDYVVNLHKDLRINGVEIARAFSIIAFGRDPRGKGERFSARKVHGRLSVQEIDGRLSEGGTFDAYEFLSELDATKFYDSNPPIPYMMSILWSHVFLNMVHDKKRKVIRQGGTVKIKAEVGRIRSLVSKFAPPSNPQCIKAAWVTSALDKFVSIKLARKVGKEEYEISYRQGEPLTLDWLIRLVDNATNREQPRVDEIGESLDKSLYGQDG